MYKLLSSNGPKLETNQQDQYTTFISYGYKTKIKTKQTAAFSLQSNYNSLLANFSVNFCGYRGVMWSAQCVPINLGFLDQSHYFSFKQLLNCPHEAEWILFQTCHYSENLVVPEIEPGTSGSAARNADH
jgi:hypothetical protein